MKLTKRNVAILMAIPLGMASVFAKALPADAFAIHPGSTAPIVIADRDDRDWHHDWRVWIPRHWQPGFLGIGGHWVEGHWAYRY